MEVNFEEKHSFMKCEWSPFVQYIILYYIICHFRYIFQDITVLTNSSYSMISFIDHAMYEQTHDKLLNNLIITW